ncbi:MAG: hypothetical protein ACON34_08580 [Flavobacteriales bacterium]
MLKDINPPKVEGMAMAVVNEADLPNGEDWVVYFINLLDQPIESVIIRSSGFGQREGNEVKTSELRFFRQELPAQSYMAVEPIMAEMFDLSNEYFVTYFRGDTLYDKRYVFVPGSISDKYAVELPIVGKRGVLIK